VYTVVMEMLSKEDSGKTSSFMVRAVMAPASKKKIINIFAATWFSANQATMPLMTGLPRL
jgi:hypothetical protein